MEENVCIDEQIVPFKGRHILASSSGIIHDFITYSGRIEVLAADIAPSLGASSNIALHLSQIIPDNKNFKLYFDNWFTSIPLF